MSFSFARGSASEGVHRCFAEAPTALMRPPKIIQSDEITPIRSRSLRSSTRGIRGLDGLFMSMR